MASDVIQPPMPSLLQQMPQDGVSNPLRTAAKQLEAGFWAEMLKSAQPEEKKDTFTSGIGETQFKPLLTQSNE